MDTTKTITHLGLCAGYGGIELGLKRIIPTLRSVALCEIEAFAIANLVAKMEAGLMEPAPIWTDLKTFPWAEFRDRVDILTGGYPCQPFSSAGKRLGAEDPRHLWPFIASGIRILRPRLCFFENVEGHISLGLREVIGELESIGYTAAWGIFSASEVGAPHQRKRVFILAYDSSAGLQGLWERSAAQGWEAQAGHTGGGGEVCWELADSELHGCDHSQQGFDKHGVQGSLGKWHEYRQAVGDGQLWPSRPGEPQHAWEPPRVVADAISRRRLSAGSQCRSGEVAGDSGCQEGSGYQQAALPNNEGCDGGNEEAGTLANDHRAHARHGEQRPERTLGDLSGGCVEGGGAEGLAHTGSLGRRGRSDGDAGGLRGEIQTSGSCGGGAETMGNAEHNGLPSKPLLRSDETSSDEWRQEEQEQTRQSSGADRPINVPSIQRSQDGSEKAMGNAKRSRLKAFISDGIRNAEQDAQSTFAYADKRKTQPAMGECFDEYSSFLGQALTLNPYGDNVYPYENISKKIRAREVLFSLWREAISKEIQWTAGGLQCFLAEKVLQSGMQLDSFTQRICYFVWCIQTGHKAQGWGLHGMWVYETCGNSSQGQEPIEQFKRELGYAMCQLSYEIALEGRKDAVEAESILQGVREASERAFALSQALPEMEEVWRSSLDQKVWEKGCYIEATSIGNRTDELRLLGNGVVPATAERAFLTLWEELNK